MLGNKYCADYYVYLFNYLTCSELINVSFISHNSSGEAQLSENESFNE